MKLPASGVAVKVCGITCHEDALAAIEAGADLLGFNTWLGTKRHIDLLANAEWIASLPIRKVALLVNATPAEAQEVAALPWIDALQFHGDEDSTYCRVAAALGKPIIKALRANSSSGLADADQFGTSHILLDACVPGAFGGTGSAVDLNLARDFRGRFPHLTLWLAGGLKPENVAAAVAAAQPRVLDVSSGVETAPGRKDARKMRAFVAAAKGW
jgi:phosphoribosylanthranilate isomerase